MKATRRPKNEVLKDARALVIQGYTKQSEVAEMINVQPAVLSRYVQEWLGWDVFVKECILDVIRKR